jgi:hypothetical protein
MKDSEFIELLNLYVDHEIGAEDATRLEAEVSANPKRRAIYRQYCRIDKACAHLAGRFCEPAPEAKSIPVRQPFAGARWAVGTAAAGLALAACVAVVLAVRSHTGQPAVSASAAALARSSAASANAPVDTVAAAADNYSRDLVPVLAVRDFSLNAGPSAQESLADVPALSSRDPLAWIQRLQLQALQQASTAKADFKPSATLNVTEVRASRPAAEEPPTAELAAFRFER